MADTDTDADAAAREPIRVLFLASFRERAGCGERRVSPPPPVDTVDALIDWLASQDERFAAAFRSRDQVRCAVNHCFARTGASVAPGDEVAFFPPVTGG